MHARSIPLARSMKMSGIIQRWTSEALPAHIERQFLEAKLWPRNQARWKGRLFMTGILQKTCQSRLHYANEPKAKLAVANEDTRMPVSSLSKRSFEPFRSHLLNRV